MQSRFEELLDYEGNLDAIARGPDGKPHSRSRAILDEAKNILPQVLKPGVPHDAFSILLMADRLHLFGKLASVFHYKIAGGDIQKTAVLIFNARHGLLGSTVREAFHRLEKGGEHGLDLKRYFLTMQQFVKPEIIDPWQTTYNGKESTILTRHHLRAAVVRNFKKIYPYS